MKLTLPLRGFSVPIMDHAFLKVIACKTDLCVVIVICVSKVTVIEYVRIRIFLKSQRIRLTSE